MNLKKTWIKFISKITKRDYIIDIGFGDDFFAQDTSVAVDHPLGTIYVATHEGYVTVTNMTDFTVCMVIDEDQKTRFIHNDIDAYTDELYVEPGQIRECRFFSM